MKRYTYKQIRSFLLLLCFTLSSFIAASYRDYKSRSYSEPSSISQALSSIEIFSNQVSDPLTEHLKLSIESAQSSIVIIAFSLTDKTLIQALAHKAEQGVKVTVIQDAVASASVARKLGDKAQVYPIRRKGLMHLKLLAIDGRHAWIGSCNFTRESLLLHPNLLLHFDSPILAGAIEERAYQLANLSSTKPSPIATIINDQSLNLYFLPEHRHALEYLIDLIHSAKSSIHVAMFTFTHPRLAEALIAAHRRGVVVEVALDYYSAKSTSKKIYQRLLHAGVAVLLSERSGLLHYKLLLIDNTILACGSANWTHAAFTQNDDCLMILQPLTLPQKDKFSAIWQAIYQEAKQTKARRTQRN